MICDTLGKTRPTAVDLFWALERMKNRFGELAAQNSDMTRIKQGLVEEATKAADSDPWKAGAPLDPRARWLSLPPIKATPEEWIWVRAHLLVGAARIRMDRVQKALTWCLITTALFLTWTALAFLHS